MLCQGLLLFLRKPAINGAVRLFFCCPVDKTAGTGYDRSMRSMNGGTGVKHYIPDYYHEFSCLKGQCVHSCCREWEIDIDEQALARYEKAPGRLGREMACFISREGTPHFILRNGNCPFLQEDGLCRLILEYGEDMLCDICREHPRFHHFFCGRMETGLGLCCEGAAKLILNRKDPFRLVLQEDDGSREHLSLRERRLMRFRNRLFAEATDRRRPLEKRVERIGKLCGSVSCPELPDLAGFMLSLERMEDDWEKCLKAAASVPEKGPFCPKEMETVFEQFLCCLLYRGSGEADNVKEMKQIGVFSILMLRLVLHMWRSLTVSGDAERLAVEEICRLYSAEIEYSDENPEKIMSRIIAGRD